MPFASGLETFCLTGFLSSLAIANDFRLTHREAAVARTAAGRRRHDALHLVAVAIFFRLADVEAQLDFGANQGPIVGDGLRGEFLRREFTMSDRFEERLDTTHLVLLEDVVVEHLEVLVSVVGLGDEVSFLPHRVTRRLRDLVFDLVDHGKVIAFRKYRKAIIGFFRIHVPGETFAR